MSSWHRELLASQHDPTRTARACIFASGAICAFNVGEMRRQDDALSGAVLGEAPDWDAEPPGLVGEIVLDASAGETITPIGNSSSIRWKRCCITTAVQRCVAGRCGSVLQAVSRDAARRTVATLELMLSVQKGAKGVSHIPLRKVGGFSHETVRPPSIANLRPCRSPRAEGIGAK
jgi:hypothetical protein